MMVLDHVEDLQILNSDRSIGLGIRLGDLEMMIAPLPVDLQVRLGNVVGGLALSFAALLASAQLALLASQGLLRGAIEARI